MFRINAKKKNLTKMFHHLVNYSPVAGSTSNKLEPLPPSLKYNTSAFTP